MGTLAEDLEPTAARATMAAAIADVLWQLDVRDAYGVCGREIAQVWAALLASEGTARSIRTRHARHENGAGFAAVGSWVQTGRPVALFVTTGPGLTNALTSLETARATGAQLILLSPLTPEPDHYRFGIQETAHERHPELYAPGRLFDVVATVRSPSELPALAGRLAAGLARRGGFMAHIAIPTTLQGAPVEVSPRVPAHRTPAPAVSPELADEIVELLADEPFAVWVGWGARHDAAAIRRLLDLTGAPVMSSPRGLGIADRHPQFIGVTGNGGRDSVLEALARHAPRRVLVLGSALGEATSGWQAQLVPRGGLIHVDLDARVFASAYPQAPTLGVHAAVGELLAAVLARSARLVRREPVPARATPATLALVASDDRPIHPAAVMSALQRTVVVATDVPVLAEAASAMFWATRHLVFPDPGRWFIENRFGAMGAMAGAVVGMAAARGGPALAIVGDGALLMQNEINAAVHYDVPAIWVVLNDSGLGIVRAGMAKNGWGRHDADYPQTDFAAFARSQGASGRRVTRERDLDAALADALSAGGPCVVDVVIDPRVAPPIGARARHASRGGSG